MTIDQAQKLCDAVNSFLRKKKLLSEADIKFENNTYKIVLHKQSEEDLPSFLTDIKQLSVTTAPVGNEYAIKTDSSPSDSGKWIDLPLSPANRHFDGPGGLGGLRRKPDLQDSVSHIATKRNMNKLNKIATTLKRLAAVERINDVDKLLEQIANILSGAGYEAPRDRAMNLYNKLNASYDIKASSELVEELRKKGFKANHKVIRLLDAATDIIKKTTLKSSLNVKDTDKINAAEETIEFLTNLVRALPSVVKNLNIVGLGDEANHIATLRNDLRDIQDSLMRMLK